MNFLKGFSMNVITYGTFDTLHYGHIILLNRLKELAGKDGCLFVGISTDKFNSIKDKRSFLSYEDRKMLVSSLRAVDVVFPEECWEQKIEDVIKYKIDVFAIGDDWKGKFDFLREYCEVVYLPRTPLISSTQIRKLQQN